MSEVRDTRLKCQVPSVSNRKEAGAVSEELLPNTCLGTHEKQSLPADPNQGK